MFIVLEIFEEARCFVIGSTVRPRQCKHGLRFIKIGRCKNGREIKMHEDGIQMDKNGGIVYNIDWQADAMTRSPPPSPTSYGFFRDNFFPSFVVLSAIGDVSLLYGVGRNQG